MVLERPGGWRTAGLAAIFVTAILPALPLLTGIFPISCRRILDITSTFGPVLTHTMSISLAGAAAALALGLAAGIMHSFYTFRWAIFFRFIFILPITVPPLLWAIGLKNFPLLINSSSGKAWLAGLSQGEAGMIFITVMITFPLVMLSTISACSMLNAGQCDAARLAGGEARLFRMSVLPALPAAAVAAFLGACLMISCPGPDLTLGTRTAVSEIMVSFSAFYDSRLAAIQCICLSTAVLLSALCTMKLTGTRPVEILAAGMRNVTARYHHIISPGAFIFNSGCAIILVAIPLCGLLFPAIAPPDITMLQETLSRTIFNTLLYAAGAAAIASGTGTAAAFFMGKSALHKNFGAAIMLVIFSLPAAFTSLGFLIAGAQAPAWSDLLFRSPAVICVAQGLRLFPLPALFATKFFNSLPASWSWTAELHGISLAAFMKKIMIPMISRPIATGFILAFLLAEADTGTVLLLHPPGAQNLPLAIFTVMANAPVKLVAQLGVAYIISALCMLLLAWKLWNKKTQ